MQKLDSSRSGKTPDLSRQLFFLWAANEAVHPSWQRSSSISGTSNRRDRLRIAQGCQGNWVMDTISKKRRSWNMSRIGSKDTKPELIVRSLIHSWGFRFRLHRPDLPGKPDIVLPMYQIAIFVHGCFWHRHPQCKFAYTPKTRQEFWLNKFEGNKKRDRRSKRELQKLGWEVIIVWECQTKDQERLEAILEKSLYDSEF